MPAKRDRIAEFVDSWRAEHPDEPFTPQLDRVSSDLAAELRSEPLREIRSWLVECEGKKTALEKEYAHLKRVHQPYSDRHEDWEYALCETLIPRLRLEIGRRARRGGQPRGSNAEADKLEVGLAPESDSAEQSGFTHSVDYRSVSLHGKPYSLTSRQAQIIEILHHAHESRNRDVGIDHILVELGAQTSRWQDTFKSNPEARKALIAPGDRKGTLRLNSA